MLYLTFEGYQKRISMSCRNDLHGMNPYTNICPNMYNTETWGGRGGGVSVKEKVAINILFSKHFSQMQDNEDECPTPVFCQEMSMMIVLLSESSFLLKWGKSTQLKTISQAR